MKKMRLSLYLALGVAVIGIILGSFFDLQISQAIANRGNVFGLSVSIIAPTIGFTGLALIGGGFLALAIKSGNMFQKIVFFVLAIAGYGASVYFAGVEYFGENGFYNAAPKFVGFLIAAVPLAGAEFLGYWLFKDNTNPYTWIVLLICTAAIGIVLVGGINGLKAIMHRPRYRSIVSAGLEFRNWWEPTKNYRELMETYQLTSEEFKSYPSGHTAEIGITLITWTILPLVCPKLRELQLPMFWVSIAVCLLVMFARILAAAHFLSDVSTGLALCVLFAIIANEITIHVKAFHRDEEPSPETLAKE